jgi:hypothetical protein
LNHLDDMQIDALALDYFPAEACYLCHVITSNSRLQLQGIRSALHPAQ